MELEELQAQWNEMSKRVDKLEVLNKKQIMEITNQKYKNRFKIFWLYEFTGGLICIAMALTILFNLSIMDTLLLKVISILLALSLIVMPVFILKSLHTVKSLKWSAESYKAVLLKFQKSKKRLLNLQRLAIPYSVFVFFTSMVVTSKLMGNDDFGDDFGVGMYVFIAVVLLSVILFAIWGNRKYKRSMQATERMISEVECD
jgi:hypothetical protein